MKKLVLIALLSANASAANTNHLYVGGDVIVGNYTKVNTDTFSSNYEKNNVGAGAFLGYNFAVNPNFDFGVELEYQRIGKAELIDTVSGDKVLTDNLDTYYINVRPKFIDQGNSLYSALILGVELESDFTYQVGLEVGYMFNDIDFSLGYRYRTDKFDGEEIKIKGFIAGMRYNF